ncbi:MAG: radical SAM protein [Candidatus Parcubacteria bacterium]|nr:radical SAM protein [Candidatus Parcubacteria bacterium]
MLNKSKISYILEVTKACNNNCLYCYNAWKANLNYPKQELEIEDWKKLIDNLVIETNPRGFAISGGEPLLKIGIETIIQHIAKYYIPVTLITNGTLWNKDLIKRYIKYGVVNFELPILGAKPETHDALTKNAGSWQRVIETIQEIKKQGGRVTAVFVLNKKNVSEVKEMTEIAIALADGLLVNFFNVGGRGIEYKNELMLSAQELKDALLVIDQLCVDYDLSSGCGIPLPECVIDKKIFKNLKFGECQIGGKNPYYAIDPAGNLRLCNHSALILGNVLEKKVNDILNSETAKNYINTFPKVCSGCKLISECKGGCKASAEVYYHDITELNPFVMENFKGIIT